MIPHGVLKHWHPMIGRDRHIPWPPGAPAPATAPSTYLATQFMCGLNVTAQIADDHLSDHWGLTMLKVTDIGPMIAHFGPPSILLAIEMPLSYSKSYWGSSRYVSKGKPVAAALLWHFNPNLNCGYPMPTVTNSVIALTTHEVQMTWGDIISGALQMGFDYLIMWAINKMFGKVNSKGYEYLQRFLINRFSRGFAQEAAKRGVEKGLIGAVAGLEAAIAKDAWMKAHEKAVNWAASGILTVAGFFFTAPGGVDAGTLGTYGEFEEDKPILGAEKGDKRAGPGGLVGGVAQTGGEKLGRGIGSYLDGGNPNGYPKDIGPHGVTD
jgi:hypothetical protein